MYFDPTTNLYWPLYIYQTLIRRTRERQKNLKMNRIKITKLFLSLILLAIRLSSLSWFDDTVCTIHKYSVRIKINTNCAAISDRAHSIWQYSRYTAEISEENTKLYLKVLNKFVVFRHWCYRAQVSLIETVFKLKCIEFAEWLRWSKTVSSHGPIFAKKQFC